MENVNSLLVDVDLCDARSPAWKSAAVELLDWGEWRSAGSQTKAASCSEYQLLDVVSAEDIIRLNSKTEHGTKQRSRSQPSAADLQSTPLVDLTGFDSFSPGELLGSVPPKIEKRCLSTGSERFGLNGYIRHDPIPALIEVDNELEERRDKGGRNSIMQDEESSTDSDDEVFHGSKWSASGESLLQRRPLIPPSKKRGFGTRILRGGLVDEMRILDGNQEDEFGAKVRRGWSWKTRLVFLTYFVLANLVLAAVVFVIVYLTSNIFSQKKVRAFRDLCPALAPNYIANFTTERDGIYVAGHQRLIRRKGGRGHLLLIPYHSLCYADDVCLAGGILAVYTDTLRQAWDFTSSSNGEIVSFTCGDDLDGDGVEECTLVMKNPTLIEVLSGADGTRITRWLPDTPSASPSGAFLTLGFRPERIADQNDDSVPELLVTLVKAGNQPTTILRVWYSSVDPNVPGKASYQTYQDVLTLQNASTSWPAKLWDSGEGFPEVMVRLDGFPGIYLWKLWSFLSGKYEDKLRLFETLNLSSKDDGMLADLNGDAIPDLIICDKSDRLLALDLFARSVIWQFRLDSHLCLGNTLGFRWVNDIKRTDVVILFQSKSTNETKMVVLNGRSGERLVHFPEAASLPPVDAVPLSLLPSASSHSPGFFLLWRRNATKLQLLAISADTTSTLFEREAYVPQDPKDERDYQMAELLNERYTGPFHIINRTAEVFFVDNFFEDDGIWRLLIHKMNASCRCSEFGCGGLDSSQPWSAFHGAFGHQTFLPS